VADVVDALGVGGAELGVDGLLVDELVAAVAAAAAEAAGVDGLGRERGGLA